MNRFVLIDDARRQRAISAISSAPVGTVVTVKQGDTRNLEQNAALWAKLSDIAAQVEWHGKRLSAEQYKDLLTAGLVKQTVVPNLDGDGFVMLGQRTSAMSKRMFSDLLELVTAFGAERGVEWSNDTE